MRIKDKPKIERPRERLIKYGPAKLSDAELLAIILGSGNKKENVLTLSNKILRNVNPEKVNIEELMKISGVGEAKACQILACFVLSQRLAKTTTKIMTAEDVYKSLTDIKNNKKEHFIAIYLNTRNEEIAREVISIGTLNANLVHPREVFEPAVKHLAASIIIAHNHPAGDPTPSDEDVKITSQLVEAGKIIGIEVIDHLIVSNNGFVSFKDKSLI